MIEDLLQKIKKFKNLRSNPVVISSRLRLARNLKDYRFPNRANITLKCDILSKIKSVLSKELDQKNDFFYNIDELDNLEKKCLIERHLISNELCEYPKGSAVYITNDFNYSIMINEEDHIRIQCIKQGFNLNNLWKSISIIDDTIEAILPYSFSNELGYLTSCPTNLGTGLRASVMLHLPGFALTNNIDKFIRASNQLGLAVRGLFGEGSKANGHIFQVSNQQTLGESEEEILNRIGTVFKNIINQELNLRSKFLELNKSKLIDIISRAYCVLRGSYLMSSNEAIDNLSYLRLAVDLGLIAEEKRPFIDELMIELQSGHLQLLYNNMNTELRDLKRAEVLREMLREFPSPNFDKIMV